MQSWDSKKPTEVLTRTYVLPARMRAAGITIEGAEVEQSVYSESGADDPSPDILEGDFVINPGPITDPVQGSVGAKQSIMQSVKGGLAGVDYVVTFDLDLSTGEHFVEDCIQSVTKYVPTP